VVGGGLIGKGRVHVEAVMMASGGSVSVLVWGSSRLWRRRRGPTSPRKGGASEAHGKMAEGWPWAVLTEEKDSTGVLLRDPGAAASLRPVGADERQVGRRWVLLACSLQAKRWHGGNFLAQR
jgi:hypothetical protein